MEVIRNLFYNLYETADVLLNINVNRNTDTTNYPTEDKSKQIYVEFILVPVFNI